MARPRSKILRHPDKKEIVERLSQGDSPREISGWLSKKYPKSRRLQITSVSLHNFRKEHLQLEGQVLKDLQEQAKERKLEMESIEEQRLVDSNAAYRNKLNEIVDTKLDVARKILELDGVIGSRMEYWYNAVASGDEKASTGDKELRQFIDRQMALLSQYKKFVEGLADKTIEHNVNITIMNDQIAIIRDVIRECMADLEPEKAMMFMERLTTRLNNASYRPKELVEPVKLSDLQVIECEPINEPISR